MGNRVLDLDDAYKYARGDVVELEGGRRVKLDRALDFLAITDHSDLLGAMVDIVSKDSVLEGTKTGTIWSKFLEQGLESGITQIGNYITARNNLDDVERNEPFKRSVWEHIIKLADENDRPGEFTAFIAFEWTSSPKGNNLHRNVIFRDDATKANQVLPLQRLLSEDPRTLWSYMADYEQSTGGEVLAIPHNGNLSNGLMFSLDANEPVGTRADYAAARIRWEPLYEVTQIKGDSETHPLLSPNDEFADFERWDRTDLFGLRPKEDWMLKFEYARSALKMGLEQQREIGINPFKFGLAGGTDSHTSLATADDDNFEGKMSSGNARPGRWKEFVLGDKEKMYGAKYPSYNWQTVASGYTAVWAKENTRAAIFDAMKRKETYASTGPRIMVRFFGGWEFANEDILTPDIAKIGYRKGVPMGGDLTNAPEGQAPSFIIWAAKDPMGANLDRVQVVKGWTDATGKANERVFNVVVSDDRAVDKDGAVPSVGSTVELSNASYTNAIGDPELVTVWRDPEFDPDEPAFYYVRVIEIPTPRWTAYDAARYADQMDESVPMISQERAYTSPIWYEPVSN
tara:strand:+ start:3125 stop:4837 length:1713 start_codon:yes stop_codon:yes gene_type:complete